MKLGRFLGATAIAGICVSAPGIAFAQTGSLDVAQTTSQDCRTADGTVIPCNTVAQQTPAAATPVNTPVEDIVVTGSLISNPNGTSTVPVTSISAIELKQTGNVSIGDVLNNLPALANTYSQANSTRFLGTGGLNLVDLYGLGTQRTLVLVNGRRHVGADVLNNAVSVDINTIPNDLIERTDIVTGGNSAIYGSDAIAGVLNFVLKDSYDGIQLRGQGNISQYGDAGNYYTSLLAGKNFAGGRGNVAIDLEYARQNSVYGSGRDYLRQVDGFVTVDTDPSGSDGNPDRVFYRNIYSSTYSNGGLYSVGTGAATSANYGRCGKDASGAAFNCTFVFQPDGTLVPQTGSRVGLAPNGSYIGGNGSTFREGQQLQLLPQLDRYSANLIGHYEISPAFVPFIEASYVRVDSVGQGGSGPAFFGGSTIDAFYERPRLDNPYLTAQARDTITQQLILNGRDPATITDATRVAYRKNLLDLGVRTEEARRETYRIVGGLKGTFNDDWKYEISGNYGEFDERTKVLGNLNVQRAALALDAVRNTAGQIVCGSQIDPTRADESFGGDIGGNPSILAADIAACQPLNPFGEGNISQAAKNYVLTDTTSVGKITQLDFLGRLTGDTSQLFSLPGGPIQFALGAEYRRETAKFRADPLVSAGYTFYNAIAEFNPPSFEVTEGFGEIRVPIVKDVPLLEDLSLVGSGRVSHYKGSAGTVYAYNGGVDYSPIRDLHLRAQYARAVRAPNLADLFSPQSQNFAPGFVDPCAARQIGTGANTRIANCSAAGVPANYDYVYQSSLQIVSGGNPDLSAEKSDSYTIGGVFQPTFVPGLALSVDYYNIKVNDVITAPSAQQIVNSCYDATDLNNQFCNLFQRVPAGGVGPNGEEPFRIVEGTLQQTLLNYAKLQVRGINTDLFYRRNFGENGSISGHFVWTHLLQSDSFLDPTNPNRANTDLGELGTPKDAFNIYLNGSINKFFVGYQLRYLSKMSVTQYEDLNSFQGRPAQNADYADILYYNSVTYHDLRLGVDIENDSQFYFGIDNLTDVKPPLGLTGIGGGSGIYESIGRRFYAGVTVKF